MRAETERRLLVVACIGAILGIAAKANVWNLLFLPLFLWYVRPPTAKATAAAMCLVGLAIAPRSVESPLEARGFYEGELSVVSVPRITTTGLACDVVGKGAHMELRLVGSREIGLGDRLRVAAVAEPPNESETAAFAARGVLCRIRPARLEILSRGPAPFRWAGAWRQALLDLTARTLPRRAAACVDALCFNVDADIDQDLRINLRRTGTIHIVSASGMHVVIVAFALLALLARVPVPRWTQLLILACALLLYAAASGLQPPVVRAAVMAVAMLSAYAFRREPDWPSAMALAALLYLAWNPASALTAGFQLSFAAIVGLGLFGRRIAEGSGGVLRRAWTVVRNTAHASFVASIASAPLVAYHFGMISIASVPANVLIGIAIAPIVIAAMVSVAVAPLSDALAVGLMRVLVEPLSGWFIWVVDTLGSFKLSAIDVPPFSAYWLLPIYGAMLCLWRKRARQA